MSWGRPKHEMPSSCDAQGRQIQAGCRAHSQTCSLSEKAGEGDRAPPRAGTPASHVEDNPRWLQLEATQQMHLVRYWDQLTPAQQQQLAAQLEQLSPELLQQQRHLESKRALSIEPWSDVAVATQQPTGWRALREGRVACLVLAGGQASRMRCAGAKGLVNISPVRNKTLFQLLAEATAAASRLAQRPLEMAIMVSPAHFQEVSDHFEQNGRFGLEPQQLHLFRQEELPLLDMEKNWFLESPSQLAMGPDGNGGALHALYKSGIWSRWKATGVELVRLLLIDNPLADPFDAGLIGCHLEHGWQASLEVVERQDPTEKMGLLVNVNGRPRIAEYSEVPPALMEARDGQGNLLVRWGNLSQFCLSMKLIEQVALKDPLPLHLAHKSAKTVDGWPTTPNCWKCERFIFDLLDRTESVGLVSTPRSRYAPLKGAEGLEQVREALSRRDQRRLEQLSGVEQPEGTYECDAQFHYPHTALTRHWAGRKTQPGYIDGT
jgi:UDP-N-acetylglucosamine/UDP-N-acetylgalactosamine diphosphorylase